MGKKDMVIFTHTAIDYDSRIIKQAKFFALEYHVVLYARLLNEKSLEMFSGYDIEFIEIPTFPTHRIAKTMLNDFLVNIYEPSFKRKIKRRIEKKLNLNYKFTDIYYIYRQNNLWCQNSFIRKYQNDYSNIASILINDIKLLHAVGEIKRKINKKKCVLPLVCDLHEAFFAYESGEGFEHYLTLELLKRNLKLVDILTAPSDKILEGYLDMSVKLKNNLKYKAVYNTSNFEVLTPSKNEKKIKLVHIGGASQDRKIEKMIEAMKYLDESYELYFHLITTHSPEADLYVKNLAEYAKEIGVDKRVFFEEPMSPEELVSYLNRYDIGVFYLEPDKNKKNFEYASPNKLFQYIQARLAVVVTDIGEMGNIVKKYQVGTVSNFDVKDFAKKIKDAKDNLMEYKENSNFYSKELSSENQWLSILEFIKEFNEKECLKND